MTILDDIIAYKGEEVEQAKRDAPVSSLEALARETSPREFARALSRKSESGFALIAEIKKASPSKGLIREDFQPADHARAYQEGGAACLSVLTDKPSFRGSPTFLRQARDATELPILRKDFMVDPYQIVEARAWGADAILLIMAGLADEQASELYSAAREWDLDVLVEVHDAEEMRRADDLGANLIGINNRNLNTFKTNLGVTAELAPQAPADAFLVAESGIRDHRDLITLSGAGAKAFLVGESLMRADDIAAATRQLLAPVAAV